MSSDIRKRVKNPSGLSKRSRTPRKEGVGEKKIWKEKAKSANVVVHTAGGKGKDITAQANVTRESSQKELQVPTLTSVIPVKAVIQNRSISYLSMGIVLTCIRHGWLSGIRSGQNPYYAFRYLIDVFTTALNGGSPLITNAPIWLWSILDILKPKRGSFKTGEIAYAWQIVTTSLGDDVTFQISGTPNPSYVFWGTIDASLMPVNGYQRLSGPAIPYDVLTNGPSSTSDMFTYLPRTLPNKIVAQSATKYESDTSGFTVVFPELGQSLDSVGALATTMYSERYIPSPLFAKFAVYQESGQYYRGWHHAGKGALSSSFIGGKMSEMLAMKETSNKTSPVLQFYNFDEFFTVLSLTLAEALSTAAQSQISTGLLVCPLSSQTVQILLRQAMVSQFSNYLAQDICLGDAFYPMKPFVVGPNGVSTNQSQMLLPTFLAENIRCCVPRAVKLTKSEIYGVMELIAVLGRPADQPQLGNYSTTNPTVPFVYESPGLEVGINIIDMSSIVSGNPVYLTASGTTFDLNLADWNKWITGLGGSLSPLVSLGSEQGVSALMTIGYTNTQQDLVQQRIVVAPPPITNSKTLTKQTSRNFIGSAPRHFSMTYGAPVVPGYLDVFTEKEILCNNAVTSVINKYISLWVLPVALSTGESNQASLQTWQTFQIEPYSISRAQAGGNGGDIPGVFPTVASRLSKMATVDVKSGAQFVPNEFISEIIELGKKGRGGFLADIAGQLAGSLFHGTGDTVHDLLSNLGL